MAYTGTNRTETKIKNLTANSLNLKENSISVDVSVNTTESIISQFQFLTNQINALREELNNVTNSSQTGVIQAFAGPSINEQTLAILPPPLTMNGVLDKL